MRVAIFSDTYPPEINGVATSTRNLYRAFVSHGHKVKVFTTNPYGNDLLEEGDIVRIQGIELKFLYDYRMAGFYNSKAMKILRAFKPDVIHIQTDAGIGQFGFIAATNLSAPTVYTYHTSYEDYTHYVPGKVFDRIAKNIIRKYVRHTSKEADEFITPSQKIKEYMRFINVDSYINVIPTGIDFDAFKKENVDQERLSEIKEDLGISKDTFVVLSIGRVAKEKSIDVCLRGYAEYLYKKPKKKTLFVIVGGGPALEPLKALATKLGISENVRFVGPVSPDTVPLYYHLGDVFVSASITETQGLTFMEAMASGIVLLCRYDDTLKNTITDNENGFFFVDEVDMAKKLEMVSTLDQEKKKDVIAKAIEGLEPYSMESFYERILHVYERAIKKNW